MRSTCVNRRLAFWCGAGIGTDQGSTGQSRPLVSGSHLDHVFGLFGNQIYKQACSLFDGGEPIPPHPGRRNTIHGARQARRATCISADWRATAAAPARAQQLRMCQKHTTKHKGPDPVLSIVGEHESRRPPCRASCCRRQVRHPARRKNPGGQT